MSTTARELLAHIDPCSVFYRNGLTPDPEQAAFLRLRPKRALICWGRQRGKSLTFGALALHTALYRRRRRFDMDPRPFLPLVLIASFNHDKAKDLLAKAMALYGPYKEEFPLKSETTEHVEFEHGGKILTVPALPDRARGNTADLVLFEEAACTDRELLTVISPTLVTTGAPLYAISTPPKKPAGWWWEEWTDNGAHGGADALSIRDQWHRSFLPSEGCPRATPEALAAILLDIGPEEYGRECLCEFPKPTMSTRGLMLPDLTSFLVDDAGDVYPGAA